jgi:hypothetical protein
MHWIALGCNVMDLLTGFLGLEASILRNSGIRCTVWCFRFSGFWKAGLEGSETDWTYTGNEAGRKVEVKNG